MDTLMSRLAYERTFTFSERWERFKEKLAMAIVWHVLPRRVRMWAVARAFADATQGEWSHVEAGAVTAFDLVQRMR